MGLIQTLRNYENDPMWADHCEMPKRVAKAAADEIERLRERLRVSRHITIKECMDAIYAHGAKLDHGINDSARGGIYGAADLLRVMREAGAIPIKMRDLVPDAEVDCLAVQYSMNAGDHTADFRALKIALLVIAAATANACGVIPEDEILNDNGTWPSI